MIGVVDGPPAPSGCPDGADARNTSSWVRRLATVRTVLVLRRSRANSSSAERTTSLHEVLVVPASSMPAAQATTETRKRDFH